MANALGGDPRYFDSSRLAEEIVRAKRGKNVRNNGRPNPWNAAEERPTIEIINGASRTPRAVDWLWDGWLPAGKLTLLGGPKGACKTTIAIDLEARLTSGQPWSDGTKAPRGDVLIWSGEDDLDDTLLPRFLAAGGDRERLHCIGAAIADGQRRPFDPAYDMPTLMDAATGIRELRLMSVDSIVSAVAGDSHKNAEVRRGLQPLVLFTSERRCSVLGITHLTKGTQGRDPVERITGSLAFAAQSRLVLVAAKPIAANQRRRLVRAASNIGPDGGGFEYAAMQEPLDGYDFGAQRIIWGDALTGTARELLKDVELPEPEPEAAPRKSAAEKFLSRLLRDGPVAVETIRTETTAAGIAWRTLERAMNELGIVAVKTGFQGPWSWRLSEDVPPGGEIEL
jgi:putative DNA primase/helicase